MAKHSYVFSQSSQKTGPGFRRVRHLGPLQSQHTICVRIGAGAATTRNPSAPLTHRAYNVLMEYFGPTMTAVAGLSSDLIGCVLPEAR